ncbi:MAG: toll/interleukin-1 receptor domain-containing protein, partial [Planctomycetes bacterium]|nr:toll/interleukin-1 receptor domain-containing protein [Planctomycetota bacterium]
MHDFFISYTGVDRPWADWIAGVLKRAGHTCIHQDSAELGTRPGENFIDWINDAVLTSSRVLCVLSNAYLTAPTEYTRAEWTAAFRRDPAGTRGVVVPVVVERIENYGIFGALNCHHVRGRAPGDGDMEQQLRAWLARAESVARPRIETDTRVRTTPQRVADWLRARRPRGLREFEPTTEFGGFRAWLFAARLPYLSRIEYRSRDAGRAVLTG